MGTLRVGVIGTGIMGTDHAVLLDGFVSGARVVRVSDVDPDRATQVAQRLRRAVVSPDAQALIADPEVEAVLVASSDATHAELVLEAVRAGKPVLCEKPLAPTLDEATTVVRFTEEAGVHLLSLGFMRRFDPAYVELKAALDAGACGTPLLVHCVSRGVSSGPGSTDASSITGAAVHEFDTVPWLLGAPVVEVAWHAARSTSRVEGLRDPHVILLRTADGVRTTMEVFLNARYGYDIRCEVVGEIGALGLTDQSRVVRDTAGLRATAYPRDWRPRFSDAYRLELQAWVDAVRDGVPSPLASGRDGLVAAAVCDAVVTSMHDGGRWTRVAVPDTGPGPASGTGPPR